MVGIEMSNVDRYEISMLVQPLTNHALDRLEDDL